MQYLVLILAAAITVTVADDACTASSSSATCTASLLQLSGTKHGGKYFTDADGQASATPQDFHGGKHVTDGRGQDSAAPRDFQARASYSIHVSSSPEATELQGENSEGSSPDKMMLQGTKIPLQHVRSIASSMGKCLNFLHIPKNAGSTLEQFFVKSSADGRVGWGEKDPTLQCTNGDPGPFGCQIMDELGRSGNCSVWHVPPVYDSAVAASYAGCDTFCVVRHPLAKAMSQHIFNNGSCNVSSFAATIRSKSASLPSHPFVEDCHWVGQSIFVGETQQHCQRVLRQEQLAQDFDALMAEYGFPVTLGQAQHKKDGHCNLIDQLDSIPTAIVEWTQQFYAADYEKFGYDPVKFAAA